MFGSQSTAAQSVKIFDMFILIFNGEFFPFTITAEGERIRISAVKGDRGVSLSRTEMRLLDGRGPIVVARNESRIALGTGMAHRIPVSRGMENR